MNSGQFVCLQARIELLDDNSLRATVSDAFDLARLYARNYGHRYLHSDVLQLVIQLQEQERPVESACFVVLAWSKREHELVTSDLERTFCLVWPVQRCA